MNLPSVVIYTAVFGGYDSLPSIKKYKGVDKFVCFTDKSLTDTEGWEIIIVNNSDDPINNNRWYKFHPHKVFTTFDISIYIDANIKLVANPCMLLEKYDKKLIAIPKHKYRNCLYSEFKTCYEYGKINKQEGEEQSSRYKENGFPSNFGLGEMSFIIRMHNDEKVINAMELWWEEFTKGCKRDQLSFMYVCWRTGLPVTLMRENMQNFNKYFYRLPHLGQSLTTFSAIRNLLIESFNKVSNLNVR